MMSWIGDVILSVMLGSVAISTVFGLMMLWVYRRNERLLAARHGSQGVSDSRTAEPAHG